MAEYRSIAAKIATNTSRTCEAPECAMPRFGFSKYCRAHRRAHERYGHPAGKPVSILQWRPHLHAATAFTGNWLSAGHPGIESAVRWCADQQAAHGQLKRADSKRPWTTFFATLHRGARQGVLPEELVARTLAAFLALRVEPRLFAGGDAFNHALARLFLRTTPQPSDAWLKRRRGPDEHSQELPTINIAYRARDYTAARVIGAIGKLAYRAADEMFKGYEAERQAMNERIEHTRCPDPVAGSSAPFSSSATTTASKGDLH